jgi:hypothetical protein
MERVVRGRGFTLSKQFFSDGVAQAPTGLPTVAIVRVSDGTTVTTTAVSGSGVGPYQVTVIPSNNLLLDTLTVTWTAVFSGQPNTYVDTVEVAGDALFSISDVRALNPQLADPAKYPADRIGDMRTTVEDAIERELGFATVPRFALEKVTGVYGQPLRVRPYVRTIRSVSVNATALTSPQIAALSFAGRYIGGYQWGGPPDWPSTTGLSNITIGYEHGLDGPSQRLRRAALLLAKIWLVSGPVDDRTSTFSSAEGGTYSLVTPGVRGSVFGVPEVDAAVASERLAAVA